MRTNQQADLKQLHSDGTELINKTGDPNLLTPYVPDTLGENIRLGLLVSMHPADRDASLSAWHGADLAVEEINMETGMNRKKYFLVVRSCDGPWGMGSTQAVNLAFKDSVAAMIASTDGRNSHLIEQVIAKTHTPVISAWATESTLTEAFVPWFFRLVPNDRQQAKVISDAIFKNGYRPKIILVSFGDYDSKQASLAFYKLMVKNHPAPADTLDADPSKINIQDIANRILQLQPTDIIFFGQPDLTGNIIRKIQTENNSISFYGNSWIGSSGSLLFSSVENIPIKMITSPYTENNEGRKFISNFYSHFGYNPDLVAAYAYDGIKILAKAVQQAGTAHDALRDSIHALQYDGINGRIKFDEHGNLDIETPLRKLYLSQ